LDKAAMVLAAQAVAIVTAVLGQMAQEKHTAVVLAGHRQMSVAVAL
jgi:predicted hotdog family 3-hydroxylacyl-ACP dehydratase